MRSGRGQSDPIKELNLLKPSAPPQVPRPMTSKSKLMIKSKIRLSSNPRGRARFVFVEFRDTAALPLPNRL